MTRSLWTVVALAGCLLLPACENMPGFGPDSTIGGAVAGVDREVGKNRLLGACTDAKTEVDKMSFEVDATRLSEDDIADWKAASRIAERRCSDTTEGDYGSRAISVEMVNETMAEISAKGIE